MNETELTGKILDLESKLTALSEENALLAEKAEETTLIRMISETISLSNNENELLDKVFEQISVLKNIPVCGYFVAENNTLHCRKAYKSFSDNNICRDKIRLSPSLRKTVLQKTLAIGRSNKLFKKTEIETGTNSFIVTAIIIIPLKIESHSNGCFVFIDDSEDEQLLQFTGLVEQIAGHIIAKLENLSLFHKLQQLNYELENRVVDRTRELIRANKDLQLQIIKREKVEQALRASEEKYRLLVESQPDLFLELMKTGQISFASKSVLREMKWSAEQALNKSFFDLCPESAFKKIRLTLRDIEYYQKQTQLECRLENPAGDKWIAWNLTGQFDADGKLQTVIAVGRDISERIKTESELQASEKKFKTLFEEIPDAVYVTGLEDKNKGVILDVNPAAEQQSGYTREELIGEYIIKKLCIEPESELYLKKRERALSEKQLVQFIEKKQRKNGELYWTQVLMREIDYNGTKAVLGVNRDISEQKHAEYEILKLTWAIEQSPVATMILNPEGFAEYANSRYFSLTGFQLEDISNRNVMEYELIHFSESDRQEVWQTVISGKEWSGETTNLRRDGSEYWESVKLSPIKNEKNEITQILLNKENISEQKSLQMHLQQAQKMESIGTLAGGIAHDFNNLLTVINGQAELALLNIDDKNALRNELHSILNSAQKATDMTRQLLAFSRKQVIEPKVLIPNEVIEKLSRMLSRLIGEDIRLNVQLEPKIKKVKADPGQLEQVLINLAVNARDAMSQLENNDEKILTIETANVHIDKSFADRHAGNRTGSHVLITVADTGSGMSAEIQEKIFEPFFTTKEQGKGTGLGLATVYGIIKQNEGYIEVSSIPGRGSVFMIYWPALADDESGETAGQRIGEVETGNEVLLLVEDDDAVREFAKSALKSLGYNVITAENGKIAAQLIRTEKQRFDLVITDLVMPEMSGTALAEVVKDIIPPEKILFTSGYTHDQISENGIMQDGLNFLHKPYTVAGLATRVRRLLES